MPELIDREAIRQNLRDAATDALHGLVAVAGDGEASPSIRLKACVEILDLSERLGVWEDYVQGIDLKRSPVVSVCD